METYDVIMLAVLAGATIFGAWKGLAWQVASLASIFVSYFIAYRFRAPVAQHIQTDAPWNTFVAMLLLYLGSSALIWLAFRGVSQVLDRMKLKDFDRHTGAVLGLARGALWCVVITLFAVTLLGESSRQAIFRSRSGYYIAQLLDRSTTVMPAELHQILAPYVHTFDERVDQFNRYSQSPIGGEQTPDPVPSDPYRTVLPPTNVPAPPPQNPGSPPGSWGAVWPDSSYGNGR